MMLVRYHGKLAGFIGATRYGLSPELADRDPSDVDRRRVSTVCEWALEYRRLYGREPGPPGRQQQA